MDSGSGVFMKPLETVRPNEGDAQISLLDLRHRFTQGVQRR